MAEAKEAAKKDPFDEMVKIHLERAPQGEDKWVFVGINGKTYQVPRGKETEVPKPVYDRLMIRQKAIEDQSDMMDEVPNE